MQRVEIIKQLLFISLLFISACTKNSVAPKIVTIGTGDKTGLYYPIGGAIARILNRNSDNYNLLAKNLSSNGSVFNINAVLKGDLDFGLAQSDQQYNAYNGLKGWKEAGPQSTLRSMFSIHTESITLVVSKRSKIKTVTDLKGKRICVGNKDAGILQNTRDIFKAFGIKLKDVKAKYARPTKALELMQQNKLDAFFYTVGHPNANIIRATSAPINAKLIPIVGKKIDKLISEYPYYTHASIPTSFYPDLNLKSDIITFGMKATIVTSSQVEEKTVYAITKELFENFKELTELHPAFKRLTKESALTGLTAPIHPGAIKYFKEAGLLELINPILVR